MMKHQRTQADQAIYFQGHREDLENKYDLFQKAYASGQTLEALKLNPEVEALLDDLTFIKVRIEQQLPGDYTGHPLWKVAALRLHRFGRQVF